MSFCVREREKDRDKERERERDRERERARERKLAHTRAGFISYYSAPMNGDSKVGSYWWFSVWK